MSRPVRRILLVALALLVLGAQPAEAHSLNGASASNYRTRITGVAPTVPGLEVKVVEAGNRVEVKNRTAKEVVVLGFSETPEPFLRIGPEGVFENLRSPATYSSKARYSTSAVPAIARDPNAPPQWRKVSDASSYRWHDHRIHWMLDQPPVAVRRAPGQEHVIIPEWKVGLRYDERDVTVAGDLTWVPGPSSLPWFGLALLAGLVVVALGAWPRVGTPAGRVTAAAAVVVVLVGLVVLDAVRLAGVASDSDTSFVSALGSNVQAIVAWLLAVAAVVRLWQAGLRSALPLAAAAGVMFAVGSGVDLSVLSHSQIPSTAPAWLSRLGVAVGLGAGLGLVGAAAWRLTTPTPAPAP